MTTSETQKRQATSLPIFLGLKTHAKTRKRLLVDGILSFGVLVRVFPTQVLTVSTWHSTHKLCGKFDQSIAVPTNMLKRFQNSCGRQHRQEPLLHNSKLLFSRQKCVLSSADEKWGWVSRYEHREIWRICMLVTHMFFQRPAGHQNSLCLCLQGHCSQVIPSRWKVMTGKKEA